MPVEVRCFGDQRLEEGNLKVTGYEIDTSNFTCPKPLRSVFGAVRRCTDFNTTNIDADLVHCHTWYSHFGGILAQKNYGIPLVITVHSLEPLDPGNANNLAVVTISRFGLKRLRWRWRTRSSPFRAKPKRDIERLFNVDPARVHVIHNGIDLDEYRKVEFDRRARAYSGSIRKDLICLFVGRITRQKGIIHLVRAIEFMDGNFQVVLCAGAPDTPEIAEEMKRAVEQARARARRHNLDRRDARQTEL